MANYLAVDSGGTKVLAILFDETFRPKAISRVGSFRLNTTSPELVARNMEQMRRELGLMPGAVIDAICGIVYPEFIEFLEKTCNIRSILRTGEMEAGLHAAGIFGDGLMTLSGTGSNVSAFYQGQKHFFGGYGSSVADHGSGYWIAREAMGAAIADYEGYGEPTLLTGLIAGHFGYEEKDLSSAIFSIYDKPDLSPVMQVASCAPLVSAAAQKGDEIARNILIRAGEALGKQTLAMIRKYGFPDDMPLTISGSVWRSDRLFFDTFTACIRAQSADRPILLPQFEPILGVLIQQYRRMYGEFGPEEFEKFRQIYPQFICELDL